jgi:hypothetical protein
MLKNYSVIKFADLLHSLSLFVPGASSSIAERKTRLLDCGSTFVASEQRWFFPALQIF